MNPEPTEQNVAGGDAALEPAAGESLPASDSTVTPSAASISAFSFMATPAETLSSSEVHEPPTSSTLAAPTESLVPDLTQTAFTSSSPLPPMTSETPTLPPLAAAAPAVPPASTVPAGSGVVFAAPPTGAKKTIKKRKGRAQKVGVGAAQSLNTMAEPIRAAKSPPPQQQQQAEPEPSGNTRDAAAEAAKRAEEFMMQKAIEEAKHQEQKQVQKQHPPPQRVHSYGSNDSEDIPPPIMPSASTDEVLAAAQKAAVEAQAQMAQKNSSLGNRIMGGIFKGFGGGSGHASIGSISSTGSGGNVARRTGSPGTTAAISKKKSSAPPLPGPSPIANNSSGSANPVVAATVTPQTLKSGPSSAATIPPTVSGFQPPAPTPTMLSAFDVPKPRERTAQPASTTTVTPPQLLTPTDIMNDALAKFSASVTHAMTQVSTVRAQRKLLLEERFVALAKERLSTQQITQAEAQLQAAAEEEDYELADQLGQVIQAHENERSEVTALLEAITEKLEQLESTKRVVIDGVASCFETIHTQLINLKEEQTSQETRDDSEAMKQFSSISKQLSVEHERLQQDLKHLERDEELVAEERKELEEAISEQSGVYEKQRDDTKEQIAKNEAEMEELRKQLKLKQEETARLRSEVYGYEDSISKVRVKFNRQLMRVSKKETSLAENRRDWEFEQAGYERQKEAHELQVQTHSQALLAREKFLGHISSEVSLAEEWTAMVQSQLDFCEDDDDDVNSRKDDSMNREGGEAKGASTTSLAQMQATVVKWEAAVNDAKLKLRSATAALSSLEKEHKTLVARLPELEQIKKLAAAKRDFKAASKASKEIKDCTARLDVVMQELTGDASQRKDIAEDELKELDAKLVEAKRAAEEQDQIAVNAKMTQLALKLAALHNLVKQRKQHHQQEKSEEEKGGPASAGATGAKRLNSPPQNSVNEVGIRVLQYQIEALTQEGQKLGEKFGGWEQLIQEHLPRDIPCEVDHADESQDTTTAAEPNHDEERAPSKQAEDASSSPASAPAMSTEERVTKVKRLMQRISEAEQALEEAVSREDYDRAAELDEVFQDLKNELEAMDLTPEETELALSDDAIASSDPVVSAHPDDARPSGGDEHGGEAVASTEDESTMKVDEQEDEAETLATIEKDSNEEETVDEPIQDRIDIEGVEEQPTNRLGSNEAEDPLPNGGDDDTGGEAVEVVEDLPADKGGEEVEAVEDPPADEGGEVVEAVEGLQADEDVNASEEKIIAAGTTDDEVDKEEKQDSPVT